MMSVLSTWLLAAGNAANADATTTERGPAASESALGPWLNVVLEIGLVLLVIGMIICIYRLLRGPSLADRVTATDTLSFEVTGLVIVLAIRFGTTIFFDAVPVVAIVGFVSTVAFAQYIGAGAKTGVEQDSES